MYLKREHGCRENKERSTQPNHRRCLRVSAAVTTQILLCRRMKCAVQANHGQYPQQDALKGRLKGTTTQNIECVNCPVVRTKLPLSPDMPHLERQSCSSKSEQHANENDSEHAKE